jgi:hypothetical protein
MSNKSLHLIRVFARYEPTTDPIAISNLGRAELARARDVAIYQDAATTRCIARFGCDRKRPNPLTKSITLNCWRWAIEWLPSLPRITGGGRTIPASIGGATR